MSNVSESYDLCIVGLGYIGLPTAVMFANSGLRVVGVDVRPDVVEKINQGTAHFEEPGLESVLAKVHASGNLRASTQMTRADAYIIAVPTPMAEDKSADLNAVAKASEMVASVIAKGELVILESTSPPGTTCGVVKKCVEESGLKAGLDFRLCYSPERVLPGKIMTELVNNDRVVGGYDQESGEAGKSLYSRFVKGTIHTTDATTAEMIKLIENTSRDVNIALANEFALISEKVGINVWRAIEIANCHPRVNVLRPGPGVGGHCIAVDPWFLVDAAPHESNLIRLSRQINDAMPEHVVERVRSLVGEASPDKVIACFGLTFKANVDDIRESPARHIAQDLHNKGYQVKCFDPHVHFEVSGLNPMCKSAEEALDQAHLLLILVDHDEFKVIQPNDLDKMAARTIYDTRNCVSEAIRSSNDVRVEILGFGSSS